MLPTPINTILITFSENHSKMRHVKFFLLFIVINPFISNGFSKYQHSHPLRNVHLICCWICPVCWLCPLYLDYLGQVLIVDIQKKKKISFVQKPNIDLYTKHLPPTQQQFVYHLTFFLVLNYILNANART